MRICPDCGLQKKDELFCVTCSFLAGKSTIITMNEHSLLMHTLAITERLPPGTQSPTITTEDGCIELEWDSGHTILELSIEADGRVGYAYKTPDHSDFGWFHTKNGIIPDDVLDALANFPSVDPGKP